MRCRRWGIVRWLMVISSLMVFSSEAIAAQPEPAKRERTDVDRELQSLAQASYETSRDGKWTDYAKLMDPRELVDFKTQFLPILRATTPSRPAPNRGLLDLFAGGKDLKTVRGWEPAEFFARFMEGTVGGTPAGMTFSHVKLKVLGVVHEDADDAHVLVRVEKHLGALKQTRTEVVSFRRVGEAWKMQLPDELQGLAQTLTLSMLGPQVEASATTDEARPE